jgi:hypothetical protein
MPFSKQNTIERSLRLIEQAERIRNRALSADGNDFAEYKKCVRSCNYVFVPIADLPGPDDWDECLALQQQKWNGTMKPIGPGVPTLLADWDTLPPAAIQQPSQSS